MCGNSRQFCNLLHRAKNGSFWYVPFSFLFATRTPTGTFHFYLHPQPPKDDWNLNPQIFVGTLAKIEMQSRVQFFVDTFEKFVQRVEILPAPLNNPCSKPTSLEHPAISQFSNYTRAEVKTRI